MQVIDAGGGPQAASDTMPVVRLGPAHAAPYRALMLDAYERHPDAFTSSVAERADLPLAWWAGRLAAEPLANELVFGCFVDGELAGVAGLSFDSREKVRHKATLFGMYVPQRFRRLGLGRQLAAAALQHARGRADTRLVQLTVTAGNVPAQALYESCGFEPFGIEPFAVRTGAGYVSKVHMWCKLRGAAGDDTT